MLYNYYVKNQIKIEIFKFTFTFFFFHFLSIFIDVDSFCSCMCLRNWIEDLVLILNSETYSQFSPSNNSITQEFHGIENPHDQFRQAFMEHKRDSKNHLLMQRINRWKSDSINKIKHTTEECRKIFLKNINYSRIQIENVSENIHVKYQIIFVSTCS